MNKFSARKFSVIIPVFNRGACISRCLNSVLAQTYRTFEIIVIDDGSTDDTLFKIMAIASKAEKIKLINYPNNKGVNYARNRGIEQARGDYIVFLDSDDVMAVDALSIIDDFIFQNPGYNHYLFSVSDRSNDKSLPSSIKEFHFEDWLSERIKGDFAHVINPTCFEELLFLEEFRIYESLNWFRVLRKNQKQLFIPWIAIIRERGRKDSVTREAVLNSRISLQNSYNYLYKFIEWYRNDYYENNVPDKFQKRIKTAILLGISIGEINRNKKLICQLQGSRHERLLKMFNSSFFRPLFYLIIMGANFIRRNR